MKIRVGPLKIPRLEIFGREIWPEIPLLPATTVFDSEWVHDVIEDKAEWFGDIARGVVEEMIGWIIDQTFKAVEPYLDKLAEDFYHRRGK